MYTPEHFRTPDLRLDQVRTGTLVTVDPATGRPDATFLPWVVLDGDRLTSHVAKVNPQTGHPGPALVIAMGADGYVSDQWMAPGAAPTWDYETIHLHGDLTWMTDPDWVIQSWDDMLRRFSDRTVADYDRAWLAQMARAVVGVEFRVTEIQAKSKLSQNRPTTQIGVIADNLEPTCPHLASRVREIALPHAAAREQRVSQALPYGDPRA